MTQKTSGIGWRFLYSRRWLGYYAMLLLFAVGCVLLSNWQLARRAEARAEINRIVTNYDREPQQFSSVVTDPNEFSLDAQKWLPVTLTGSYTGSPALVRNRPGVTGSGTDLVQAFTTSDGVTVFVDRGWTNTLVQDSGRVDFSDLPVAATGQQLQLTGRLRPAEPQLSGSFPTADSVGSINPTDLAQVTKTRGDIYSGGYIMLTVEAPKQPHGKLPQKPELDEGPHLSYALQWIVFIGVAAVGVGFAARTEFRNFNRGSAEVAAMDAKRAARKARRGKTDADEEDELLDNA